MDAQAAPQETHQEAGAAAPVEEVEWAAEEAAQVVVAASSLLVRRSPYNLACCMRTSYPSSPRLRSMTHSALGKPPQATAAARWLVVKAAGGCAQSWHQRHG